MSGGSIFPHFNIDAPMPEVAAPPTTPAGTILREAAAIVDGQRRDTNGAPERSFAAIGVMWTAYLKARDAGPAVAITGADVAAMMLLLKVMRSEHGQHTHDHGVDAAGYAAIWAELRGAERRGFVPTPGEPDGLCERGA